MSCHLYAFLNIFWVGIYITYLVYSSKIISKYKHTYNSKYIQKYLKNWNTPPILNIRLVKEKNDCSSDTEKILTLGHFPGTKVFCDCNGSMSGGFCNQEKEECHTIYFFSDQLDVDKWKNRYFCVTYLNISYEELRDKYERDTKDDCNNICGFFDSSNTSIMCLDNNIYNIKCPINGINIINKKSISNKLYISDKNEIEDDDNNEDSENIEIEMIEEEEDLPIMTDITLSSGESVCSHPYEGLFGQSDFKYNILKGNNKCETSINDNKYDTRYNNIDKTTLEKLGSYNLFYYNYIDLSEKLNESYNTEVSISYTSYFHMNKKIYNNKFKKNGDIVKINMSKGLLITVIVFSSIFLLINVGFCLFAVLSCLEICELREEYLEEPLLAELIIKYIGWVLNFIFLLIINIKYFKKRKSIKNTIKDSFEGDQISIYAYDLACDNFYKVKTLLIIFDILFGVEMISIVLGNLMYCFCPSELGDDY